MAMIAMTRNHVESPTRAILPNDGRHHSCNVSPPSSIAPLTLLVFYFFVTRRQRPAKRSCTVAECEGSLLEIHQPNRICPMAKRFEGLEVEILAAFLIKQQECERIR